ncbi:MAG: hypothetical protein U0003_04165 [Vampirovibrionales bacterium]
MSVTRVVLQSAFKSNLLSSLGTAVLGEGIRAPGRFFRVGDVQGAPKPVQNEVVRRESLAALSSFGFIFASNLLTPLFTKRFTGLTGRREPLVRGALAIAGTVLSEGVGRLFSKATFADMMKAVSPKGSRAETTLNNLQRWLTSPWALNPHPTSLHTTSGSAEFGRLGSSTPLTMPTATSPTFYSRQPRLITPSNSPSPFQAIAYHA